VSDKSIPYSRQRIGEDDIAAVSEVLSRDLITQGPEVASFEEELAGKCGAKYAVCFNSGTSALWAAVASLGLEAGSEGIVPAITFAATATALVHAGLRPVIVDVDPTTGNVDPEAVEAAITERTSVIMVVHYAGLPAPMGEVSKIATKYGIPVIEDAAHALGSSYNGLPVGSCTNSAACVFSFHPVKAITTGEGGALVTNDSGLAERATRFRHHGILSMGEKEPWLYDISSVGINGRITDFQCALGRSQLRKLDAHIRERNSIALSYDSRLSEIVGISPAARAPEGSLHAYHLYAATLEDPRSRRPLFDALLAEGVRPQVHYIPLHYMSLFRSIGAPERGFLPGAERFYEAEISLPIFPGLSRRDQERVIGTIEGFFESHRR
jgi:dTDP-4-amino-4,6-dideoxygalactose transaminase